MWECSKCGKSNDDSMVNCLECRAPRGSEADPARASAAAGSAKFCGNCGAALTPGMKFCGGCGAASTSSSSAVAPAAQTCAVLGQEGLSSSRTLLTVMLSRIRQVSVGSFILLLVLFLFPFVRLACGSQEIAKISGYELAFGKTLTSGSAFGGSSEQHRTDPSPLALLALAAAVAGAVLCAAKSRGGNVARAVVAGVGLLMLILLWGQLSGQVSKEGSGVIKLKMEAGYVLALLAFTGTGILNAVAADRHRDRDRQLQKQTEITDDAILFTVF